MVQLAPQPTPLTPRASSAVRSPLIDGQSSRLSPKPTTQFRKRLAALSNSRQVSPRVLAAVCVFVVAVGVAGGSALSKPKGSGVPPSKVALSELPLAAGSSTSDDLSGASDPANLSAVDFPKKAMNRRTTTAAVRAATTPSTIAGSIVAPIVAPIVVHAAGAVMHPGVYVMVAGARAADVVFAAGGLSGDADADRINLAVPITDGSRLYIPHRGVPVPLVPPEQISGGTAAPLTGNSPSGASGPVNLNTATAEQLDSLPGVGPATASAIIEHRTKIGRYRSVSQLLDVPGIGEAKLAAMRKQLTVG
jgi:comEA protein